MQVEYDKYTFSVKENTVFCIAYVAAAAVVSMLFYRNVFFAPVLLIFFRRIRELVRSWLIERRKRELLTEFKDLLFMLATSIGAGRSIKDAIGESIAGIVNIYGEKSVLDPELRQMHMRLESANEKDTDVLMDFAIRTGSEDVIDFVNIYAACKVTGASLIIALNKAASVIIDKMTVDREIRELVKRKKNEGILIFCMPVIVIIFLNACSPDYIDPMYNTLAGRVIMTVALCINVMIFGMIKKITFVEI